MNKIFISLFGFLLVVFGIVFFGDRNTPVSVGSIQDGMAYTSTTTSTGRFAQTQVLKVGPGTLGSVVITGAAAGAINLYDATSTSILQRSPTIASSTILLANMPASLVGATYTFDVAFDDGLIFELISGTMPTTTITWR
jgi:hypothetical protein